MNHMKLYQWACGQLYSRYKSFNEGLSSEKVMEREQGLLKAAETVGTVEIAVQAKDKSTSFFGTYQG